MTDTATTRTVEMTAVFPLVGRAADFATRIQGDGWKAENVKQAGRTVTWTAQIDTTTEPAAVWHYTQDMLDTVGYYGSDQKRKATLNGIKAPMSY